MPTGRITFRSIFYTFTGKYIYSYQCKVVMLYAYNKRHICFADISRFQFLAAKNIRSKRFLDFLQKELIYCYYETDEQYYFILRSHVNRGPWLSVGIVGIPQMNLLCVSPVVTTKQTVWFFLFPLLATDNANSDTRLPGIL